MHAISSSIYGEINNVETIITIANKTNNTLTIASTFRIDFAFLYAGSSVKDMSKIAERPNTTIITIANNITNHLLKKIEFNDKMKDLYPTVSSLIGVGFDHLLFSLLQIF